MDFDEQVKQLMSVTGCADQAFCAELLLNNSFDMVRVVASNHTAPHYHQNQSYIHPPSAKGFLFFSPFVLSEKAFQKFFKKALRLRSAAATRAWPSARCRKQLLLFEPSAS